ncbi:MAG: SpoVA/SpoVAEb family sporulation membrane protein, partial [Anaerovoracaceae bacterium]
AIVAKFVNLEVVPPADSMDAVGFAPLITGFQAIGMFNAFLVSGVFCLVGQVIFVNTKLDFVKIFMGCVVLGVILSATGVMSYITNFGSGGMFLSVIDAGEAAYLALKGLVLEGDLFNICRYTILVLGILVTGVACGFIAKKTAND